MAGVKRCKGRTRRRMFACIDNVVDAGKNQVVGGGNRHGSFGGEPTESITNECSASGPNPHSITAIRVESGTSVPAIDTMGRPKVLLRWLFVNEDANAGWSQRCPIEIEITVEGSPRRQLGMETRGAQEI
jgi:hypothetical protein